MSRYTIYENDVNTNYENNEFIISIVRGDFF